MCYCQVSRCGHLTKIYFHKYMSYFKYMQYLPVYYFYILHLNGPPYIIYCTFGIRLYEYMCNLLSFLGTC